MALTEEQLSGGLPLDTDYMLPEKPADPEMREGVSVWLFDEEGRFGFPRMGIEAVGESWDSRPTQMNIGLADGRVLIGSGMGAGHSPIDADGKLSILGAGPLSFRCIEPYRRWTVSFDGPAIDTHFTNQIEQSVDPSRRIPVRLEAELTMTGPAWTHRFDADDPSIEAFFMGIGYRAEQLLRGEGVFEVDGEKHAFKGVGLRVHRQSIRRTAGFYGHCWQSAQFPDGSGFAINVYPEREGQEQYNTGYIWKDGRMIDARVVKAPWLFNLLPPGEDVSVEIESALGRTRIEGTTLFSTFLLGVPEMEGTRLCQAGARYNWDGQTAIGMVERSL